MEKRVTVPTYAEAKQAERVKLTLMRMAGGMYARHPGRQSNANLAESEREYLTARRASDLALVIAYVAVLVGAAEETGHEHVSVEFLKNLNPEVVLAQIERGCK